MSIYETARRAIRRHALIAGGDRVVAAVSGGPDSVALLLVLQQLAATESFELAGVAHLNHQLRGTESDGDEAFCRRLAAGMSLAIDVECADVAGLARGVGVSVEHAAHDERYAFFVRAATRLNAQAVAVAHTRDDQAETFLLRLLRGAGPRGLGGMHPRAGLVIRPFIDTSRAEIRTFLEERRVEFRDDRSNADLSVPRNRIRHELIPLLEDRFSSGIIDVLDRETAIAREDAAYLDQAAADVARRLIRLGGGRVELSIAELLRQPAAIARRVVREAQRAASGGRFMGFEASDAVLELAVSNSTGPIDLPGHRVNRVGETLVLTEGSGRPPRGSRIGADRPHVEFRYELDVPGEVTVPEAACAISAEARAVPADAPVGSLWPLVARGDQAVVEGSGLARPLVVRNRRPGDSFRPLGLRGHKKLQDLFVDAKIRREMRDSIPVVVDASGEIVWVAGLAVAEQFRVTDGTRAVVILKRVPSSKIARLDTQDAGASSDKQG